MLVEAYDVTVLAWRIWYKGGACLTSKGTTLEAAPKTSVLGVVAYHPDNAAGEAITSSYAGLDWYVYDKDAKQFHQGNDLDGIVEAMHVLCSYVFAGEWTTDEEMGRVEAEMIAAKSEEP